MEEEEENSQSVAAGEFGLIDGQPPVIREVIELDLAKHGSRDRRGSESPRVGITAEFEAGQQQADTNTGLRAGDQGQLREEERRAGPGQRDAYQTALGLRRHDLALHAGNRDLRGSRFPLVLGAEPRDGFLVRLDLGGRGFDLAAVDDLPEFQARGVVVHVLGRGWAGRRHARAAKCEQKSASEYARFLAGIEAP